MPGKFQCTNHACLYKRRRITFDDGATLVDGVDCTHLSDREPFDEAPECPFCASATEFVAYDVASVTVAKYSAMNADAKRAHLIKRRDAFDKSKEGRAMKAQAEYHQLGIES